MVTVHDKKHYIIFYLLLQLLEKRIKERSNKAIWELLVFPLGLNTTLYSFYFCSRAFNLPHWDPLSKIPLNSLFLPYNPVIMVSKPSHAPSSELYFGTLTFLILFLRPTALSSPRTWQPSAAISLCCGERSRIDQYEANWSSAWSCLNLW